MLNAVFQFNTSNYTGFLSSLDYKCKLRDVFFVWSRQAATARGATMVSKMAGITTNSEIGYAQFYQFAAALRVTFYKHSCYNGETRI